MGRICDAKPERRGKQSWSGKTPARSARPGRAEKRIGGAARSFFGSLRRLEPRDFSLQDRNALGNLLRGQIIEALSDLVSRGLFARRRAKNLVVLLRHCKRPRSSVNGN